MGGDHWGALKALAFRILFVYVAIYISPIPVWDLIVPWFGNVVLGIEREISTVMTGSGDTTFHWVQLLLQLLIAVFGGCLWTGLRRGKKNYDRLLYWLTVGLRYFMAMTLCSYGFAKLFKTQFPFPSIERLIQPYGESSPMGLVWTFMGYSTPYNVFTGFAEVVGGLLLLSRRTRTLGAMVIVAVMTNVLMLNFCYDVPVKIFSSHLVLFAVFLVALDRERLWNLFIRGRATGAQELPPMVRRRWARITRKVLKVLMVLLIAGSNIAGYIYMRQAYPGHDTKPPLYGLYEVEIFSHNDAVIPPLITAEDRWRYVIVDRWNRFVLVYMDGRKDRFKGEVAEDAKTITATRTDEDGVEHELVFHYTQTEAGLQLEVEVDGAPIRAHTTAVDLDDFLLVSRGFHWVNETPYNR